MFFLPQFTLSSSIHLPDSNTKTRSFRVLAIIDTKKKEVTFEFKFGFDFVAAKVFGGQKFSQLSRAGLFTVFIVFYCEYTYLDFTFAFDFNRLDRQQCGEGPGRPPVSHISEYSSPS